MGQRGLPEEVITEEVPRGGRAAAGLVDLPREAALSRGQAFRKAGGGGQGVWQNGQQALRTDRDEQETRKWLSRVGSRRGSSGSGCNRSHGGCGPGKNLMCV